MSICKVMGVVAQTCTCFHAEETELLQKQAFLLLFSTTVPINTADTDSNGSSKYV